MRFQFRPYVPVAQRRAQAAREVARRSKEGKKVNPVVLKGRTIASTFWGKAWCGNLESYSDFANRLPRGKTYVRNGSVADLQIQPGKIVALVSGSELYDVKITMEPLSPKAWQDFKKKCAGQIGSVVELLNGQLSTNVISLITARAGGLFPKPQEIKMSCSCPDWATMCKHVAAVMYGVGSRLDDQPELFFTLRKVDYQELIQVAVEDAAKKTKTKKKTLAASEVASVFGIEIAEPAEGEAEPEAAPKTKTKRGRPAGTSPKRAKTTSTAVPKSAATRTPRKKKNP